MFQGTVRRVCCVSERVDELMAFIDPWQMLKIGNQMGGRSVCVSAFQSDTEFWDKMQAEWEELARRNWLEESEDQAPPPISPADKVSSEPTDALPDPELGPSGPYQGPVLKFGS